MKLSQIVKKYRTEHGLSQRQFSEVCGMSTGYISMLEEGVNPRTKEPLVPSLVTMKKLSRAMGVGLDELMNALDGDTIVSLAFNDEAPVTTASDEREKEFLSLFSRMTDEEQALLIRQMRGILAGR